MVLYCCGCTEFGQRGWERSCGMVGLRGGHMRGRVWAFLERSHGGGHLIVQVGLDTSGHRTSVCHDSLDMV